MSDRWDYYEITFSLEHGDEDDALAIFEAFQQRWDVSGAVFSAGNHGPHPFSKAAVDRATKVMYDASPLLRQLSLESTRELLEIGLAALFPGGAQR